MHIQADRALIPAHTPAVRYLTVTISAPGRQGPAHATPPVNVALVLDRSGSMDGKKIQMARSAVAHAIKLLNARDHLSVVVYDNAVDTVLESSPASKEVKAAALAGLAKVEARGATNLSAGWFKGVELAARGTNAVKRVLLLTDGLANEGVINGNELADAAAKFRADGVSTSTFGVGADFDEELLSRLATIGGGHFYFIEQPKQIPDLLASELGETLDVVARDAVFEVTFDTGIEATVLSGFAVDATHGRVRVELGDLIADQEITLVVAISCAAQLLETTVFVDCRVTDRDGVLYQEPMRMEWRATDVDANGRQAVNHAVLVAVAEVLADRARATALSANRRGNYTHARSVLRDIIEHLGGLAPGNDQVLAIIDGLRRDEGKLSEQMDVIEAKSRHFASYSRGRSREATGKARRTG